MQRLIYALLLVAINVVVFGSVRHLGFVWTDRAKVHDNERVASPSRGHVLEIWQAPHNSEFAPLSESALAVQRAIDLKRRGQDAEPSPKLFHVTSFCLHTVNSVLVLLILSMFFNAGWPAFVGAMAFAFHPIQVESVAWISSQSVLLGAFFALFAIWQYLIFVRKQDQQARRRTDPKPHFYLATISFICAMLAWPAVAILPIVVAALEAILPRKDTLISPRRPVWPLVVWGIFALPLAVVGISLQETTAISSQTSLWFRPLIAGDAVAFYLFKLLVPYQIGPDYGRSPTFLATHWAGYVTWIVPVVITLVLMFWRDRARSWVAASAFLLVGGVLPYLGLIAFEGQATSTVANRYLYLGMLGPALILAYLSSLRRQAALATAILVAVVALAYISHSQLSHWQNDQNLWSHALSVNPQSPVAHKVLGDRYREQKNWDKARFHYDMVLKSNSSDPQTHFYLAEIERARNELDKAIALYEKTLALNADHSEAYLSLGRAYAKKKEFEKARPHFEKAVEMVAGDARPFFELGAIQMELKNYAAAIPKLKKSLDIGDPKSVMRDAQACAFLGRALIETKRPTEAQSYLERAVSLRDSLIESHRLLADIYFSSDEHERALPHYQKASEQISDDPALFRNLGTILLKKNDSIGAIANFEKSLELEPGQAAVMTSLGIASYNLRRFKIAEEHFSEALKLRPNTADAHYYLGDISRWRGKIEAAIPRYYRALKIDKTHAKAHYRLGNYFLKKDSHRQAIWHFRQALKGAPEESRYIGSLKRAQRRMKEEAS